MRKLKLKRLTLNELAEIMPIVSENEQQEYEGGGNGTSGNPYTYAEYESLLNAGRWTGGYVVGMGYTTAEVTVTPYDPNDCWWHCIAYINNGGSDYGDRAARSFAREYYGSGYNPFNYAMTGNKATMDSYFQKYVRSGYSGQILVFDPSSVGYGGTPGVRHAVIVHSYIDGLVKVFDPQIDGYRYIDTKKLNSSSGYYIKK